MTWVSPTVEVLLAICVAGGAMLRLRRGAGAWADGVQLTAGALTLAHLGVGEPRWQLIPLYAAAVTGVMVSLRGGADSDRRDVYKTLGWTTCLLVLCSAFLHALLPPLEFPPPDGTFPVGVRRIVIREDLEVRLSYPANDADGYAADPFLPGDRDRVALADRLQLRPILLSHLSTAGTDCRHQATLSEALIQFPAVVVFPDSGGVSPRILNRWSRTFASSGYAVAIVLPEGRAASREDAVTVLDWFEALEAEDREGDLANRIDAAQVAVMGFGVGSQTALEACSGESWFKAGVVAVERAPAKIAGVTRPVLVVGGAGATEGLEVTDPVTDVLALTVPGFSPDDLSDLPLVSRGGAWGVGAPVGRDAHYDEVADYALMFLDQHLKPAQPEVADVGGALRLRRVSMSPEE